MGNSQILILGDSSGSILVSNDAEEWVFYATLRENQTLKITFCVKIINHLEELNGLAQYHACVKIYRTFFSFEVPVVYFMT